MTAQACGLRGKESPKPMKHICLMLAEKVMMLFEEAGASEIERLVALDIARALVPVAPGSLSATSAASAPAESEVEDGRAS